MMSAAASRAVLEAVRHDPSINKIVLVGTP